MYFSMSKLAVEADARPPQPAFSVYTAMAIFGASAGAKAIKTLWS